MTEDNDIRSLAREVREELKREEDRRRLMHGERKTSYQPRTLPPAVPLLPIGPRVGRVENAGKSAEQRSPPKRQRQDALNKEMSAAIHRLRAKLGHDPSQEDMVDYLVDRLRHGRGDTVIIDATDDKLTWQGLRKPCDTPFTEIGRRLRRLLKPEK